jgi:SAM-dependent methyltransferase
MKVETMSLYENFAKVYDCVMDQALYDQWLAFSLRHFPEKTHEILELACGSGALSRKFTEQNFDVLGVDLSPEMLILAEKRAPKARFELGDMRKLPYNAQFDVVSCYSDSLCYLSNLKELRRTIDGVYAALREDGVFLFDVHSIYQMDTLFSGYSYHENEEDYAFLWDSYPGEVPHSIEHDLTFFIKDEKGSFLRRDERHKERTYPMKDYLSALDKFSTVEVYADFSDRQPTDKSRRWFFVCKK